MSVKIFFFGRLAESVGIRQTEISIEGSDTAIASIQRQLINEHPSLDDPSIRVALNQTLVNGDSKVSDGDELAFFPPVSGG